MTWITRVAPGSDTRAFATGRTLEASGCCDCTGSHPATCVVRPSPCTWQVCYRLGSGDENLAADVRAARRGQLTRVGVDIHRDDAVGRFKRMHVAVFAVLVRALHELHPDGQSAVRAFQLEIAIVVEAHPHDADQLGGKPGKPAVARGAGLAGRAGVRSASTARQVSPRPATEAPVPERSTSSSMLTRPDKRRADRWPGGASDAPSKTRVVLAVADAFDETRYR